MPNFIDLTKQKFGRLRVIKRAKNRGKHILWKCRCSCIEHNITYVTTTHLRSGHTTSCGCWSRERATKHGMHKTPTYSCWLHMMNRCYNKNNDGYKDYGGRGIKVCHRWHKFENFYADMGERPKNKTLDRYPNRNGNYKLNNCRWASQRQQNNNTRRNIRITINNRTRTLMQWCRESNIKYMDVYNYMTRRHVTAKSALMLHLGS